MAWNIGNKNLSDFEQKAVQIGPGAPIAYNPSLAGKPYKDAWDIERAYREGMQKVTWVNRCIDAIAGNQARLPMILRKDNSPEGEIVKKKNSILDILNSTANQGENSFIFRYRLSSQLLMSSRGAFIEKVRGRNGEVVALHLLPPQHTAPIPDPRKFVSGFEVDMRNGTKVILRPEDVIWVRRPHPLDPYLSMTPMEAAGIAIEIENLAKIYNRNFLLNDGRPGGLIVVRGEIDDDDKDELRSRFRGNLSKTGAVTVLSSDEGVDFVDTGASPRDAAYIQMRQITKEEILSAFGVPESVIGNAAGRTFSNAGEEIRVFWVETMMPHLMQMARALDNLDPDFYVDFDTSQVPVLVLYKQERERYLMDELQAGLISPNEYRVGTGKKEIDSDLMNAMLANPNLTPIGYTNKPFDSQQQQQLDMMGAQPGAAPGAPPMAPGAPGEMLPPMPGQPLGMGGGMISAPPAEGMTAMLAQEAQAAPVIPTEVGPVQGLSANVNELTFKSLNAAFDEWDTKAEQDSDRWVEIMDRTLERIFDRQNRVVLEKASGTKAKKNLEVGKLEGSSIFDVEVWNKQLSEDLRPVIKAIIDDSARLASQKTGMPVEIDEDELNDYIEQQISRAQQVNNTTKEEILAAILIAQSLQEDEDKSGMLRAALAAIFLNLLSKRRRMIAEHEAQAAYNAGTYFASRLLGAPSKTWVTRKDAKVRPEHILMQGETVDIGENFVVDGVKMRFPGDPSAPVHLTINCRCRLKFDLL
jgi:HK97 family phage portal protein